MSKIEVNQISSQCGSTLTIGQSGDTVTLACGASQTGFGRTGTVNWDTTAKTVNFTAVSGNGYFVNTTSGAVTMTLPATPSAGDIVSVADYANTFATNNLTVARNGSLINGGAFDYESSTNGISLTFVYVDGTRGWKNVNDGTTNATGISNFIIATGGTVTCCGDYKIHTFTGPGTFTVTNAGNPCGSDTVDYLVVAGGGAGATAYAGPNGYGSGGGGAGGYRESSGAASGCYTVSPLGACVSALPVTAQGYPITVGGGGTTQPYCGTGSQNPTPGMDGSNSVFSTITSTGGGGAGTGCLSSTATGRAGGSGGGSGGYGFVSCSPVARALAGTGNTPPVSPAQGNPGGQGTYQGNTSGGGGGGATTAGSDGAGGPGTATGGDGGAGATSSINGTPTARAGGGGGGAGFPGGLACAAGAGGTGGGGAGNYNSPTVGGIAGTANTGGGGGGGGSQYDNSNAKSGGAGGSGIVIIRYKYQ